MNNTVAQFFVLLGGLITLATVAVLVSKNANTTGVFNSFFQGFGQDLSVATAAVTGVNPLSSNGFQLGNFTNLGIGG